LTYAALSLWTLGYPDQALVTSRKGLALAQRLAHPHSLAFALTFSAFLHQLRREEKTVQELTEADLTLSTEQEFALWLAVGTLFRGWALDMQGQREEGMAQMHRGLAAWRATGAEGYLTYYLTLLAEACLQTQQIKEGLSILTEALELMQKTGERWFEAELYRLKGELVLQFGVWSSELEEKQKAKGKSRKKKLSDVSSQLSISNVQPLASSTQEVEAYFLKAIEVAQKQQAKSWELRAVMSLSRLWQSQGKHHKAHTMLSEIYNWFTEGFDTKDLQEAKVLLEELASAAHH
jgi:predicted ATPase